jgi:hypothetical protein
MKLPRLLLPALFAGLLGAQTASADIVFFQDFSAGGDLSDYINATADPSNSTQFTELSTSAGGGTWSIENNALVLDRTSVVDFSRTNVLRRQNLDGGTLFSVQFSLSIEKETNFSYDGTEFLTGRGDIPYGGWDGQRLNTFRISGAPSGTYQVVGNDSFTFNLNEPYIFRIYSNFSGSAETYIGPDNLTHNLGGDHFSLWIGDTLVFDNRDNNFPMNGGPDIESFAIDFGKPDGAKWVFDDFIIRNDLNLVPEPAGAVLALLGAMGLATRRRRKI